MNFLIKENRFLFTSQSFTLGHPDKLCDYISDSVLDACLSQDPNSKVGCQCVIKNQICMVFGEISTKANLVIEEITRKAIKEAGYSTIQTGLDYKTEVIVVAIDKQSPDIAQSVHLQKDELQIGAGDQGLMIGYATDETESFMPLSLHYCNLIVKKLQKCRQENEWMSIRSSAKVFVTVEYEKNQKELKPISIHTIGIQCQSDPTVPLDKLRKFLEQKVIRQVVHPEWLKDTTLILNPNGIVSVPKTIMGLTGRKIIADTYGGWGGHGGGAFSGKDCSKVDRSGGYVARWIAKSLVANRLCKRVFVQISYSIGLSHPLSVFVDSYQTVKQGLMDEDLISIVQRNFDLRPGAIIQQLKLKRPIFRKTSYGGHFGRDDPDFTWQTIKDLSHQVKKIQ